MGTPSIGRIVIFRSRTGRYSVPAIITATLGTLAPDGVEAWRKSGGSRGAPPLSGESNVHLTVFTPGLTGLRATADDFVAESEHPVQENEGGSYPEWDVPIYMPVAGGPDEQPAGTWAWPERL